MDLIDRGRLVGKVAEPRAVTRTFAKNPVSNEPGCKGPTELW